MDAGAATQRRMVTLWIAVHTCVCMTPTDCLPIEGNETMHVICDRVLLMKTCWHLHGQSQFVVQ